MEGIALPSAPLAPPKDTEPCHSQVKSKWVAEKWVWNPKRKLFEWVVGHFEREGDPQVTADALKLLYERNTDQFKYYLTWRQLMFAGYFAVFSAIALGFRWMLQNSPAYSCICPFLGAAVSFVFWALDHRNLRLYEIVAGACVAIEQALGNPLFGYFSAYETDKHPPKLLRHKWILTVFYGLGGLVMLAAGVLAVIFHPSIPPQVKSEVGARLVAGVRW